MRFPGGSPFPELFSPPNNLGAIDHRVLDPIFLKKTFEPPTFDTRSNHPHMLARAIRLGADGNGQQFPRLNEIVDLLKSNPTSPGDFDRRHVKAGVDKQRVAGSGGDPFGG
jgi:hypothetical protein